LEMESLFYEQFKKIRKATGLLQATINGTDFTKTDVGSLLNQKEREAQMKSVYAMPNKLDFTAKKERSKKPVVAKAPKEDTKVVSLELFLKGKSIIEIAEERKMVMGTIEGHLAHYVALQEISAKDILGRQKLDNILQAIKELKTMSLAPIRDHLGKSFTFGEIKIGIAAHLAEN
ncbi:MAG: helix-turn-helix domain-containing protein, partial [Flavobacterium sp.]|uniref:helix-turn-helix domain-containing protein n=1 Tax=Flavobacterium sp. TaxID=239 RepID=UPI003265646B